MKREIEITEEMIDQVIREYLAYEIFNRLEKMNINAVVQDIVRKEVIAQNQENIKDIVQAITPKTLAALIVDEFYIKMRNFEEE